MSKHLIYVSDNYQAEDVSVFYVESDASPEDVVKAVALETIKNNGYEIEDIESLEFGAEGLGCGANAIIQFDDYHLCVWEGKEEIQTRKIDDKYFDMAKNILDGIYLSVEDDEAEIKGLLAKIEKLPDSRKSEHELH